MARFGVSKGSKGAQGAAGGADKTLIPGSGAPRRALYYRHDETDRARRPTVLPASAGQAADAPPRRRDR